MSTVANIGCTLRNDLYTHLYAFASTLARLIGVLQQQQEMSTVANIGCTLCIDLYTH